MKVTTHAVAEELRRIANAIDKEPDAQCTRAHLLFSCGSEKDDFLNLARLMPRPLKKEYPNPESRFAELKLIIDTEPLWVQASVYQSVVCELVEPAKPAVYRCQPLLSDEEEAQVSAE